jgi:hypothetical protein
MGAIIVSEVKFLLNSQGMAETICPRLHRPFGTREFRQRPGDKSPGFCELFLRNKSPIFRITHFNYAPGRNRRAFVLAPPDAARQALVRLVLGLGAIIISSYQDALIFYLHPVLPFSIVGSIIQADEQYNE